MSLRFAPLLLGLAAASAGAQESLPSFESTTSESSPEPVEARVYGVVRLDLGVDTAFEEGPPGLEENVSQALARTALGVDVRLSASLRALVEARLRFRAATQAGFERTKAFAEAEVGEAFVDVYSPKVDLRLGQQVMAFGANVAFAPTDILNPRDLRFGFLLAEPEDSKLPVPAVRALGQVGRVTLTGVVVPFFVPSRYTVFGQDESLLQPASGVRVPRERVDPSIEDRVQPRLLETERPMAFPWLGDFGARATLDATSDVKVGLSWVWANEKLPRVTLDPEAERFLLAEGRGEPLDPALGLSLQNRLRAGETLYTGSYGRQHVFAIETSALVHTTQLDVDLGYSPAQTLYDARLRSVRKPVYTAVIGATQAEDSPLRYGFSYVGLVVPDVAPEELLFLLEPGTARGGARTAFFHLFAADLTWTSFGDRLRLGLRALVEPVQQSFAVAPSASWAVRPGMRVGLAAELYQGARFSPFGYFRRNDQLLGSFQWEL